MLAQTLELFGLPDNWPKVAGFYIEAVADVPADLVASALRRVRLSCKWFPKPAEIRAAIAEELAERKTAEARLRMALKARSRRPSANDGKRWDDLTDEEKAAHEERMAALRESLAKTAPMPMPMPVEATDAVPHRPLPKIETRPLPSEDDAAAQEWLQKMGTK